MKDKISISFNSHKSFYLFTLIIWTFLAVIMTEQYYTYLITINSSSPLYKSIIIEFVYCYLCALFAPVILWIAFKLDMTKQNWLKITLAHLVICLAMILVTMGIRRVIVWNLVSDHSADLTIGSILNSIFRSPDYAIMGYMVTAFIGYTYKYYFQYKQNEMRALQLETELAYSQLQALKMQLQPHFLFNTLNSISALVRKNENSAAVKMISGLGNFLRSTLDAQSTQEVNLKQEIVLLKLYLDIQQTRFQDRLVVSFNISPETMTAKVPNLILQPLVENAIKHGVSEITSSCKIEIDAVRENGFLKIAIKDDGKGLEDDPELLTKKGIGITNTQNRLNMLYGKDYKFDLNNNTSGGTTVTLTIPYHQ